jgi:hypothetical protein
MVKSKTDLRLLQSLVLITKLMKKHVRIVQSMRPSLMVLFCRLVRLSLQQVFQIRDPVFVAAFSNVSGRRTTNHDKRSDVLTEKQWLQLLPQLR